MTENKQQQAAACYRGLERLGRSREYFELLDDAEREQFASLQTAYPTGSMFELAAAGLIREVDDRSGFEPTPPAAETVVDPVEDEAAGDDATEIDESGSFLE